MLSFHNFFQEEGLERGLAPSQMMVIKLKIKKMHFKNVDH